MKKNNLLKKLALLVATTFALGTLTACGDAQTGQSSSTQQTKSESQAVSSGADASGATIDYAYPSEINVGTFLVTHLNVEKLANALGYFDEEFADLGVKVNLVEFASGGAINEAFASGSVDFAFYGDQPTINGIANNVPVTILGSPMRTETANAILVRADSDISTVEELAGKKVAVTVGTAQHKILLQILDKHGLTEDDIELNNLKNADALTALAAGEIDAVLILEPSVTTYTKNGTARILEDGKGFVNTSIFVGRTEFVEQYPEITKRYIKALLRAEAWREENSEEAAQIIADIVDTDSSYILEYWPKYDMTLRASNEDIQALYDTAAFLREKGGLDHDITLEGHYDFSYLEDVLATEGK